MHIVAYSFDKRKNSTSRPTGAGSGTALDGVLKEPCSITSPRLMLLAWHREYNYVYIEEFNRYYFVEDVTYLSNTRVMVQLQVDVLASYRPAILTTNAYVIRATKAFNVQIPDTFYPTLSGTWQTIEQAEFVPLGNPAFILGCIGGGGAGSITGAVTYYIVSETDLANLMTNVFDPERYTEELSDTVVKTFFNPTQYITTCMYCPFLSASGGSDEITLGWWDTGVKGTKIGPRLVLDAITLSIPRTDDNDDHYINYAPWSKYRLYIPFVGFLDIEPSQLRGNASISITSQVDTATGELMCWIKGNNGRVIATARGNACATIPIAQTVTSVGLNSQGAMTLGGMVGQAVGNALGGSFGDVVSDIGSALMANATQFSINGTMGTISERFFETDIMLILDASRQVDTDLLKFGSPLCETRELSDLQGGYVKCLDAHFANTVVLDTERAEIESYLNGGVYLE